MSTAIEFNDCCPPSSACVICGTYSQVGYGWCPPAGTPGGSGVNATMKRYGVTEAEHEYDRVRLNP